MPYQPTGKPPTAAQVKRIIDQETDRALVDTARYVRSKAAQYPPKANSASYQRTGTLGRSIAVGNIQRRYTERSIEVGTNLHYARYVEEGTGLYGPAKQLIRPKTAKVLAWRSVGAGTKLVASGLRRSRGQLRPRPDRDIYMVFARYTRGMRPWHYMRKAFEDDATAAYFRRRIEQAAERIGQRIGGE